MKNLETNPITHSSLNGAEKVILKSTIRFHIEYGGLTYDQAEQKGFEKIASIRKMSKELSNPKSKAYFPY